MGRAKNIAMYAVFSAILFISIGVGLNLDRISTFVTVTRGVPLSVVSLREYHGDGEGFDVSNYRKLDSELIQRGYAFESGDPIEGEEVLASDSIRTYLKNTDSTVVRTQVRLQKNRFALALEVSAKQYRWHSGIQAVERFNEAANELNQIKNEVFGKTNSPHSAE